MASNDDDHCHPASSSLEQPAPPTDIQFSFWHTFKPHIPRFLLTILIDVVLPLILFLLLQKKIKSVYALLISGIPPLIMIILKAILSRTFDALGFIILIGFLISAIIGVVTKNDIALLLEKSLITSIVSIIFGTTLIPFKCCQHRCRWRPLAYYFYQDLVPTKRKDVGLPDGIFNNIQKPIHEQCEDEVPVTQLSSKEEVAQVYEWIYEHCSSFRFSCYIITSIWSIGLLLEFVAKLILILVHLSTKKIVIYGNAILSTITAILIVLTIICITKERKRTLASIKQWKEEYLNTQRQQQQQQKQELRQSDVPIWIVTDEFNTNNMIHEMNDFIEV